MILEFADDFMRRISDPRTEGYFLASSAWQPILIVVSYLLFVNKIGPWWMQNRKPYNVKKCIICFDILQILINFYMTIRVSQVLIYHGESCFCRQIDRDEDKSAMEIWLTYCYFFIKVTDLLDTVFFILKKNFRQASYLHTYHHSLMVTFSYITFRYAPGGHAAYLGILNSVVHTIMYTYYLLTAIEPKYKNNLVFKTFVTKLQLAQFILLFISTLPALRPSCGYPKFITSVITLQAVYFVYLFGQFYYKEYIKKAKQNQ